MRAKPSRCTSPRTLPCGGGLKRGTGAGFAKSGNTQSFSRTPITIVTATPKLSTKTKLNRLRKHTGLISVTKC